MRLYMKQKVFSFRDRFTIKDEYGEDKYFVAGKILSLGKQLSILDKGENELAFIRQKVLSFMPRFFVEINGETVAEIVKKFTFLKPKYEVAGLNWKIEGDFFAHDFTIMENDSVIAAIHKKWMSWGDTYEIDIGGAENEVLVLAVVLAIDAVAAADASAAAASSST